MNRQIDLVLPYPPSANRYFRVFRGRAITSAEAKAYKEVVAELVGQRVPEPWTGPIRLQVDIFRPRRAGDLSNCLKVLEDALRGVVFVDDSQTVDIHLARHEDAKFPRAQVRVTELSVAAGPTLGVLVMERPPGWEAALAKLEGVRQKRLAGEKRRTAKKAATSEATTSGPRKSPDEVGQEVLQAADDFFARASTSYRKGSK
jgi:crossover junction endodeoxyribonuclease RusA